MTWREFQLRSLGYVRKTNDHDSRQWLHTREISYNVLVGLGVINPKKLPIEKFMPIGENGSKPKPRGITERGKELLMKAIKQAVNGG
ncbi:hypothetical protein AOB46_18770 [Chryseobacterium indologenes]|uniref:Uncharacterized protein n=1 Tax=Chryseobacterium indologenes TaxID=253 RepID=A0A0N1KRN8_CHRID|nr:hypothetical protein AOB46_18770 [Chryseobacterium indologenes]